MATLVERFAPARLGREFRWLTASTWSAPSATALTLLAVWRQLGAIAHAAP